MIKSIEMDGDFFVMIVELGQGHKEKWTYVREENSGLTSYIMLDREDA